jgi:multidrug efflux pump subunit AcrA (membrane-fusion protein)
LEIAAAQVRVAEAALQKLVAGAGDEEKSHAQHAVQACEAELTFAKSSLERLRPLVEKKIRSEEELEGLEQQVTRLEHQRDGLIEQHKTLTRPTRAADLQTAQANLDLARAQLARVEVEQAYTVIRAPQAGTVLKVMRHPGDSVTVAAPTPIVLLANTSDLQVRLEMDEANVPLLQTDMTGAFTIRGVAGAEGRVRLEKIIPVYGPKRLFSPDTSLGHDTRMLEVLCRIEDAPTTLYLGQRVTARFELAPAKNQSPAL